ncbi:MAG: hypothetical protein E7672_05490 [Ruminococcaceae bacterium]|nr:hypothetical protein [Oscillospiraceae bacterium]
MNGLISLENISLRPVSEEILDLNAVSKQYGLILSEEDAKELSDTRNRSLTENERIEIGVGPITDIIKRFCTSKYLNNDNYTYVLNEVTYLFYYIKTETDDNISDSSLIDELFERFELYCRGSIDLLQSRETERIIRKINSGDNYYKWYADRDELDNVSRVTPTDVIQDGYGKEYFDPTGDTLADHDYYEDDIEYRDDDTEVTLDAYDEFLQFRELLRQEDYVNPNAAKEDMDDDEENENE